MCEWIFHAQHTQSHFWYSFNGEGRALLDRQEIWPFFNEPLSPRWILRAAGPNCTKFGKDTGQTSALPDFVLDFRYIAPFWKS